MQLSCRRKETTYQDKGQAITSCFVMLANSFVNGRQDILVKKWLKNSVAEKLKID
jgi:hypothetical protein